MKIFGKKIGIVAVLMLLVVGVGSAAVVSYLSNMGQADVDVTSPMTVELSEDNITYQSTTLTLDPRKGGETSTVFIRYENHANQDIEYQIETLITCDATAFGMGYQIDHADFEDDGNHSDYAEDVRYGITAVSVDGVLLGFQLNFEPVTHDRGNALAIVSETPGVWPDVFPANTVVTLELDLHHAPNAVGTYTITSEIQDDATAWI